MNTDLNTDPGEREAQVRAYVRRTLYEGPYTIGLLESWIRYPHPVTGHPKRGETDAIAWAFDEVAAIAKDHPGRIIYPPKEPAIMLEYDEVSV